jgi:hypothetical protein
MRVRIRVRRPSYVQDMPFPSLVTGRNGNLDQGDGEMEKRTLLRQVLRDLIDNRLEYFASVSVYRSIEFQPADPGVFPGFLDCGRVNAEFEDAHGFLNAC